MSQHAPPTVTDLEQLDERARGQLLLTRDEDQWFDRKGARISAPHLADALVGLANAQGGLLVIGITRTADATVGELQGVDGLTGQINAWTQAGIDFTEPTVPNRLVQLRCEDGKGTSRFVALIEVPAGERLYKNRKGDVLLRVGDETKTLKAEQAQQLAFEKGSPHFDGTLVPVAALDDLDPAAVEAYVTMLPARVTRQAALEARGFLRRDIAGILRPTVAAVLLFGRSPQAHLASARLRVLRYRGRTREVGTAMNIIDDVAFDGTLVAQIDRARTHIREVLPETIRLDPLYGRFASLPLIPDAAWEEALTNAVLHRSYALGGDHIRVEVFSDRLEVTSPGRLPGPVNRRNITSTRYARNPSIARAMTELRYARELTEGVRRMFDTMEQAGFARPILDEGAATFTVTFLFDSTFARMLDALPRGADRFIAYLVENGGRLSTAQAMSLLGMSKPAALRHLRRLAAAELLERREQSPNDPTGYWQVRAPAHAAPVRSTRVKAKTPRAAGPRA